MTTFYKKIVANSNAWQNVVGVDVPRWLMDNLQVARVEQIHVTVNIRITLVDSTQFLLNSTDWIVLDGDTNVFTRYVNSVFVTKYVAI